MLADKMSELVKWLFTLGILAFIVLAFWIEVLILEWVIRSTWPGSTPTFWPVAIGWALVCALVRTNRQKK